MFGAFWIAKARAACVQALQPLVTRPSFTDPWPPDFWRDPFVVGFVVAVTALITKIVGRGKLTRLQSGHVVTGTLKDLGAPLADFQNRAEQSIREGNPDYKQGLLNGETLVVYVFNLDPMTGDPDVAAATEMARHTTLTGKVDRDEIGGSLMHLLFHQVVKKRLGC